MVGILYSYLRRLKSQHKHGDQGKGNPIRILPDCRGGSVLGCEVGLFGQTKILADSGPLSLCGRG